MKASLMVKRSFGPRRSVISINLGRILRRSDLLGQIYGWIPSGDLLGSVTRVPYVEELYIETQRS